MIILKILKFFVFLQKRYEMKTTNIIENFDLETLEKEKTILKSMQVKFKLKKAKEYNAEFVEKILESKEQVKNGKTTRVDPKDFKEFWGAL
jgi:hypothetical protein